MAGSMTTDARQEEPGLNAGGTWCHTSGGFNLFADPALASCPSMFL